MIRAIIIDDEPLAIDALTILLNKKCKDEVQIIASSNSPKLGRDMIEKYQPDLVFIDVEMPGMSGIDLVHSFPDPNFKVVFVTAFDAYAIEALRLSAIDYLLKPVEPDEISRVISKVKSDIQKNDKNLSSQLHHFEKLLLQNTGVKESRIGIGMADKIVFVDISNILYCIAEGAYTNVYLTDGRKIVASRTLGDFEQQLITHDFFRIHHSNLINLRQVKEFQRFNGGFVIMSNNEKLEVSHRKKNDFLKALDEFVI